MQQHQYGVWVSPPPPAQRGQARCQDTQSRLHHSHRTNTGHHRPPAGWELQLAGRAGRGGGPRPGHGRGWSVSVITAATSLGPGLHLPRLLCCAGVTCGAAPAGSGTQVASSLCQPGRRSRATSGTTSRGPAVASSPPSRAHRDSRPATGHVTWTLHTGLGRKWEEWTEKCAG